MTKQVAVYARVAVCATEDQLLSQIKACRKYTEDRGWTVVAEVTDNGMSGATLDRAGLKHIRYLARAGEIDAVVVYSLDRLAREVSLVHLLEEELEKRGAEIRCTQVQYDDTLSADLLKQMRADTSEHGKTLIVQRLKSGKQSKEGAK